MVTKSLRNPNEGDLPCLNLILLEGEMYWPENQPYKDQFIRLYTLTKDSLKTLSLKIVQVNGLDIGFFALKDQELVYFYIDINLVNQGFGHVMWDILNEYLKAQDMPSIRFEASLSLKGFYEHMGAHIIDQRASSLSINKVNYVFQYTI